jgi:hypothetical protein
MTTSHRFVVGEIDGSSVVLSSEGPGQEVVVVRLPLSLLPIGTAIGHVIDLSASRCTAAEQARTRQICDVQAELRARLAPSPVGHGEEREEHR